MRINTPIIDQAFDFPADQTLVSMTDLKGRIVYCNAAFVAVSGYAMDELIGQPHNLIRHPDMPEEAFRDLWATIASGRPWSAPVKNRRKDGSYYWVQANVTPVLQEGKPVGYMSVRTHAPREVVLQAGALYADLRAQRQAGRALHRLEGGHLRRNGWRGHLARWANPGLPAHLALATLGASAAGFLAGFVARGGGSPWVAGPASAWTASAAIAGALAAAGLAAWHLRRITVRPLARLQDFCNRMAAGDLGQRLAPRQTRMLGDLAGALNQLNVNLLSVVGDARGEAEQLRGATVEIAAGNTDLSARTEAQAASLEQTASSMEQITRTVQQSGESARQAAELAHGASDVTRAGSQAVGALYETIQHIQGASQRIGDIISVIDGIAFQTSILSLNAAVEAARAGEQGRGFAVVASEVRALAQRTSVAAREIKGLIESSGRTVDTGTRQAGEARTTMDEALRAVEQVSQLIQDISRGAQEQMTGLSQVNEAVGQLDAITQQNATLVQQVAASAVGLQGRADALAASVRIFQLKRADTPA